MKIDISEKFNDFFDKCENQRKIDFLVFHHIEADNLEKAIEELKIHKVSSHYIIDEEGNIFQLVEDNNIAFHAGISFWNSVDGLNKSSIGIELLNSNVLEKKFSENQMNSLIKLAKNLVNKYQILQQNIVSHSDIAYDKETNFLNRKQDPSHLFDWKIMAQNNIGIFAESVVRDKKILYKFGDENENIHQIKLKLKKFGYRVVNLNNFFDEEMKNLSIVFNRRFIGEDLNYWCFSASEILEKILTKI
jgi:N-acetylmuramoyl-L-alanine amidase